MDLDAPIAVSLMLHVAGAKLSFDALRILRSPEVRAIEDNIVFYEKVTPLTKTDSRRFILVLGLATYCSAWLEYFSPSLPPFTGRFSWLYSSVFQNLGSHGLVLLWTVVATLLVFSAGHPPKS
jgi:hypothetical protein